MNVKDKFVSLASLICEPARAKMLWYLRDGKAFTAIELSMVADISHISASNHLSKLLNAGIIKVDNEGRHRYYVISNADVAMAVRGLVNLAAKGNINKKNKQPAENGIKYCRTCYDHLAGYVGVEVAEALEKKGYIEKSDRVFLVTDKGWKWFGQFQIYKEDFQISRRPLTRQCLDWSERKPHLAGQLGSVFLDKMIEKKWFQKKDQSRELVLTTKGRKGLRDFLQTEL